jgi:hypothetical protein
LNDLRRLIHTGNIYQGINSQLENLGRIIVTNSRGIVESHFAEFLEASKQAFDEGNHVIFDYRHDAVVEHQMIGQISDEELSKVLILLSSPRKDQRDTGAYFFLSELIENDLLSVEQKDYLLHTLLNDLELFNEIDIPESSFVYQRSFAILLLSVALGYRNPQTGEKFLPDEMMDYDLIVSQVALYSMLELNTKGFDTDSGWIHAYLHIGNAVAALINNHEIPDLDRIFLVATLLAGYHKNITPYTMGEIDRVVDAMIESIQNFEYLGDYFNNVLREWEIQLKKRFLSNSEAEWNKNYNMIHFQQNVMLKINEFPPETQDLFGDGGY